MFPAWEFVVPRLGTMGSRTGNELFPHWERLEGTGYDLPNPGMMSSVIVGRIKVESW